MVLTILRATGLVALIETDEVGVISRWYHQNTYVVVLAGWVIKPTADAFNLIQQTSSLVLLL
jgi:hypothetical protein